jgi:hypothetical protein
MALLIISSYHPMPILDHSSHPEWILLQTRIHFTTLVGSTPMGRGAANSGRLFHKFKLFIFSCGRSVIFWSIMTCIIRFVSPCSIGRFMLNARCRWTWSRNDQCGSKLSSFVKYEKIHSKSTMPWSLATAGMFHIQAIHRSKIVLICGTKP